jgi:putative flippase GtrA
LFTKARHIILAIIDFFHRPFRRWINERTFRYLACGGSNQVFYILLYFVSYNYVLQHRDIPIHGNFKITSPIAAYIIAFGISAPAGFILSRHIVFPESNLHGRVQIFRYAMLMFACNILTYLFLKFFDEVCGFCPNHTTLAAALTSVIIAVFSYLSQINYTFKVKEAKEVVPD